MPSDTPAEEYANVDFSQGIKVNFSDEEAASKSFDDLPVGKYNTIITDVELQFSASEKNKGKPMYNVEFTIQDGQYANQKIWTYACLWDGALYTVVGILKALGEDPGAGSFTIPAAEFFIGKPVIVALRMGKAQIGDGTKENPQYAARPEAKGFFAPKQTVSAGGSSTLLP